jgi:TldD protein
MVLTRRQFVQAGSSTVALALLPTVGRGEILRTVSPGSTDAPDLPALAARAIDAARAAGAAYADVRLTLTRTQTFMNAYPLQEVEEHGVGIRVLVNGYWGFLGSALWTADEMARLAREAVAQAQAHSRGKTRTVELGEVPKVVKGTWTMPVKYDPFDVPIGEKMDVMNAAHDCAKSHAVGISTGSTMNFSREMKVFASTEGSSWTQTTYNSGASFSVGYHAAYHANLGRGSASADFLSPAGLGWEHILESGLVEAIPALIDEAEQSRHIVPVDVGRYEMVFTAPAAAALLDETIGAATELDRAMGYEANAGGTSYLDDPLQMLGTEQVGAKLLSVTADRSTPGGVATVKWDDECVVPDTFPIVRDGVLVDYQTIREQATWIAPYYKKIGHPIRSHGCAGAESALSVTMQQSPNLSMVADPNGGHFEDLIKDVEKGIAVYSLRVNMDQQQLNGVGYGTMREITKGKLGRFVKGGAVLFRAPELWKHLRVIGGPQALQWCGLTRGKGQPWQRTTHSVGAVPAVFSDVALIDALRKSV